MLFGLSPLATGFLIRTHRRRQRHPPEALVPVTLRPTALRTALAVALAFATLAPSPARAVGGIGDLFVSSDAANNITAYNGVSGNFLGVFTNSVLANAPLGLHFGYGPSAGKVLLGSFGGGVDEFDATTGAYIKTYSPVPDWQWAGIYAPNGNAYVGSMATLDVREYDAVTGAFIRVLCPAPGGPADMQYGPNGHLYICEYMTGSVREVDAVTGGLISFWSLPPNTRANDIAFLPSPPRILVMAMGTNLCYVYSPAHVIITAFFGSQWGRPHGIAISPHDGNIYIADGVSTQVSVHDPSTYAELNPAFCVPGTTTKIVDLEFRPDEPTPARPETWGRMKDRYRK
jgi:DNA-binding beta-propeller fold protein YncE